MNCQNCGKELEAGQAFCSHCGQDVAAAETSVAATSTNAVPAVDADGYPLHWVGSLPIWENFKMCMTKKFLYHTRSCIRTEVLEVFFGALCDCNCSGSNWVGYGVE